jgi:hypothetical protein
MLTKNTRYLLFAALLGWTQTANSQSKIQVVHNAPNAPAVDIYVNNQRALSAVPFRAASGFLDVPSGVPLQVRIKPAAATADTSNPVFFRTYNLAANTGYYLIANGNLGTGLAPNPDGINTAFDITVLPEARENSTNANQVDLRIFHGVTDAPTVDIKAQGVATLVDNAPFRGFSGYLPVPAASYTVQISPGSGSPNLLAYKADVSGLAGQTLLVLASGYFNPAANQVGGQNGPGFGLWAFTRTGQAIELSKATSQVQVVHNAGSAPTVDVFINGQKAVPGLEFRKATPFVTLDAGVPLTVALKGASASNDTSSPAFRRTYELAGDNNYYIVANGNLGTGFAANPDGINTGFDLTVIPDARTNSGNASQVDLRIFHGVTDAPTVDIKAQGVATLVDNAPFRGFSGYLPVPAASYTVQIAPGAGTPNLLAYKADVSGLAGQTLLVLASGYFNPAANQVGGQNGPGFGLWAFTRAGQAIELGKATSKVQVVHNSASAPSVDVFINGAKAVPGLEFRKATPFVTLDAGVPLTVALKGASASTDTSAPAFRQTYELAGDESYTLVATGLLSTTGYAANPNGRATGFDITVMPGARQVAATAATSNNADVRVLHACTDAPIVDVRVQGGATLVDNAGFRDFTPYISAPNVDLTLEVTDAEQTAVVAAYTAPLSAFTDSALVVMASGFLTPSANQNGPGFGLLAVRADGTTILLPVFTSVKGIANSTAFQVAPNPASGSTQLVLNEAVVTVQAIDALGRSQVLSVQDAKTADLRPLKAGLYTLVVESASGKAYHSRVQVQ